MVVIGENLTPKTAEKVVVEYSDITMVDNWNEVKDVDESQLTTIGWLLEDSEKRIVLASTYDYSEDRWASFTIIPRHPPEIIRSPSDASD